MVKMPQNPKSQKPSRLTRIFCSPSSMTFAIVAVAVVTEILKWDISAVVTTVS